MDTVARVFNHASKPISVAEFKDAVQAVCRPRFPMARAARPQRIVLAVSGGVDSMAMAFLFSKLLRTFRGMKISDNPCHGAFAVVIDHQLREGSDLEAAAVAKELRRFDIKVNVHPLTWKEERKQGLEPKDLPNLEGLARTYRYRLLGNTCYFLGATSMFFAHHRDDQYETVLMRLLAGHRYRGLQGIRDANSIPECHDVHGVYKSGLIDDQLKLNPSLSFKPGHREMRRLRLVFKDEQSADPENDVHPRSEYPMDRFPNHGIIDKDPQVPFLKPLDTEDGGTMIYRPLLEFDKDRLIATCEANNVKWFEDHTNLDPTLTTRNAIRYLVRNHELPRALQKPAILDLSARVKRRARLEEAEAHRFLVREAVIKDFDPNAGTLLVRLPSLSVNKLRKKRRSLELNNEARRDHLKLIMAAAVRKLIDFVTPEYHLPPLANLENAVRRLFPELSPDAEPSAPKAFVIAGVLFGPIVTGSSVRWFLSRAPYTSTQPLPMCKLHGALESKLRHSHDDRYLLRYGELGHNHSHRFRALGWKKAKFFDGRFWIRIGYNNRSLFQVRPFQPEHAKAFRKSLSPMRRARLEKLLKYYAPGKVRYSLPALYCVERERDANTDDVTTTLTLLALPTLGIHVPGLERWVRYEARYKKVDTTLLGHLPRGEGAALAGYRRMHNPSRQRRIQRMMRS